MSSIQMHKEQIKCALRMKHGTLKAFEKQAGLPDGSVKDVLRGRASSATEKAVAKTLKRPLQELFPSRYPDDSSTKVDDSAETPVNHRLSGEAA